MAKDGTNRGGARLGAGAKKKPLADKIATGNPGGRALTVMEFSDTANLKGQAMPEPNKMLEATQKDGKTLSRLKSIKTWQWLNQAFARSVSPQLLERYAMSVGTLDSMRGSGYESVFWRSTPPGQRNSKPLCCDGSELYDTQTNRLWYEIFQLVKEKLHGEYSGASPQDDVLERLLSARRGKIALHRLEKTRCR